MLITFYDSYNILNKVYSDGAYLKQAMKDTIIDEKNRSLVTKICYGVLDKDITLQYIISKLCDKNPKLVVRTILKISLYSIIYLEKHPYAVTDNAVKLMKKLGKGGMSGFVNGVLRRYLKEGVTPPSDKIERLSYDYSYPIFAVKKLLEDYPEELAIDIMKYDNEVTYVRFNSEIDGEGYLRNKGVEFTSTPYKNLFIANKFHMDEGFYEGEYTFQSIGSVAICDAFDGGKSLLDTCAAPGGKSVLLSEKYEKVTSLELYEHRAKLISSYAERMNRKNIEVIINDSTKLIADYVDKFDGVLCDVPCSGFGVIKENPDIKINRKEEDIKELNKIQLQILNVSSNYVKKGGTLVYSTCSIFKDENEKIVQEFLKNNREFIAVKGEVLIPHLEEEFGRQLLPNISGGGFYFAKLKRI